MNLQLCIYSGCGCDAIVYDGTNYGGRSLLLRQQNAKIANDNFNDRTESAKIFGTCSWIFYKHSDFKGESYILTPGNYPSPSSWGGQANSITSARALPPAGTKAIILFQNSDFEGRMLVLYRSQSSLPFLNFNDKTSSIIITGGSWTVYNHSDFKGSLKTLGPGHYPTSGPLGGNDKISSVRSNN